MSMISINDYAAKVGRSPVSVRQKAARGAIPGAVKIGRDWLIPEDAPYIDLRVKQAGSDPYQHRLILIKRADGTYAIIGLNHQDAETESDYLMGLKQDPSIKQYKTILGDELSSILKATMEPSGREAYEVTTKLTTMDHYEHVIRFENPDYLTDEQFAVLSGENYGKVKNKMEKRRFQHEVHIFDTRLIWKHSSWPV